MNQPDLYHGKLALVIKHKIPTLGADSVVFTMQKGRLKLLLIERGHEPYKGRWALPGGFMEWGENALQTAGRELEEETSLKNVELVFLGLFSKPGRDPRGTILSAAHIGLVDATKATVKGGDDAEKAEWFDLGDLPPLAFDHEDIVTAARHFFLTKMDENAYAWFQPLFEENPDYPELKKALDGLRKQL